MADENQIHPLNVTGEFFNDTTCIDCGFCTELAPFIFRRENEKGLSYVYTQPKNQSEKAVAIEALENCPTESIGRILAINTK